MEFIVSIGLILVILELRSWKEATLHEKILNEMRQVRDEQSIVAAKLLESLSRAQETAQQAQIAAESTSATIDEMRKEFELKLRIRQDDEMSTDAMVSL